jgi:hypothetical protein
VTTKHLPALWTNVAVAAAGVVAGVVASFLGGRR